MFYINKIINAASQQLTLTGIPNVQIGMTLQYMPRIQQWNMGITYGDTIINGILVKCSVNILRQWKNNLPFGIACIRADGLDPYALDDFQDQLANLYLLNSDEVITVENDWFT